jgi:hypothetical protein
MDPCVHVHWVEMDVDDHDEVNFHPFEIFLLF